MTQCEKIRRHLEQFHSITPHEALREYGCMRLAARIADLKKAGMPIESRVIHDVNRFGERVHYSEYYV